jgi:hypothetical protein
MGQLANVVINGLDNFSQKPISQPAFAASAIVICNLLPDWLGQNKKLPNQKRGFFFFSAYYLLSGLGCARSALYYCVQKVRKRSSSSFGSQIKAKTFASLLLTHTEEIVLSWESKAPQKEDKPFNDESRKLLRSV